MKSLGGLTKPAPPSSTEDKAKRLSLLSRLLLSAIETLDQTWLLVWKTALVLSRHPLAIWAQILAPVLVCFFVFGVQCMVDSLISKFVDLDPLAESIDRIPLCKGVDCVTLGLGYTAGETIWTTHVVEHIRKEHSWTGNEVRKLGNSYEETLAYLSAHPNNTQAAVIFCTGPFLLPNTTSPLLCSGNVSTGLLLYSLVLNFTSVNIQTFLKPDERNSISRHSLPYKIVVDRGIFDYLRTTHDLPPLSLNVSMSDYPHIPSRMTTNFDTMAVGGPMYFFLPPMIVLIMLMSEMVREKEQHLRAALNIVGIRQVAYWASWLIVGLVMDLVVSCITVGIGRIMGFDFFTKAPFG